MPSKSRIDAALLVATLACAWLATAPSALAQQLPPVGEGPPTTSPRIALKLELGAFGSAVIEDDEPGTTNRDDDMLVAYGFGAEFGYPILKYLTVGAGVDLSWINFEDFDDLDIGRSMVLDIDLVVHARYPVDIAAMRLEPYVGIPLGMSFLFLNDENIEQAFLGWADINTSTKLGWNLGLLAGAILWVHPSFGVLLELGWMHHQLSNEFEWRGPILGPGTATVDAAIDELAIRLGGALAF